MRSDAFEEGILDRPFGTHFVGTLEHYLCTLLKDLL